MVIDTLQLDIIVNNKGTTARINNTTNALKNLHKVISDINGAGGVNAAVNGGGGSVSSSRGGSSRSRGGKSASSLMKNLNFGSMIAKLYFVRNITKQLGQDLAKVVQYGIDYEETLNLWQVAMKGNISQARIFVNEMRNAYGISSATLMNYQATFKNMLSALGNLNDEVAYGLSEALTGMALDYASLYNTSIEGAMTKFQAVLAGQVRPIRSESGYDITESTIFALYQSLGGTKTVRQLDQTEKRLLRILAVYKQMQGVATGDLSKTITSSANQIRVMKEQSQEFATWIGVAFNTLLEKSGILIEINAYLYALTALAQQFAISLGYVEKDYSIKEPIEEANTALDGANDKVDELKGKLLGFDKFQVLSSAETDTAGLDISQEITKAIEEYRRIINDAENPAFKRSLELLQAWGLELDENGNIIGGFDKVKEKVTDIAKSIGGLITFIGLMTKPWMVFVGAIELAYWTNEDFRNSINDTIKRLGSAGLKVFKSLAEMFIDIAPALAKIVEKLADLIEYLDEIDALDDLIWGIVGAFVAWKTAMSVIKIVEFTKNVNGLTSPILLIATALGLATSAIMDFLNWGQLSNWQKVAAIFKVVAAAAFAVAAGFAAAHTTASMGVAAIAIGAGLVAVMGSLAAMQADSKRMQDNVQFKANGGLATKGSLFYAGEAGPELVTQTSGGGSTIMNMKQLEDAVARGMIRGAAATQGSGGQQISVNVSGRSLFSIFVDEARSNGYELVKVR